MKKLLLTLILTIVFCTIFVVSVSAATYYCDKEGNLVDGTSENVAYEFDLTNSRIPNVYLHDSAVTKIVIPDIDAFTGTVQLQADYDKCLGVYTVDDKEAKANSLITQITEVVVYENIYLDGAYSVGTFAGYTNLKKLSFYGTVGVASKGGFFGSNWTSAINEMHFYGENLAIPSVLFSYLNYNQAVTIVFHEGSSGTISTGGETLPYFSKLNNWTIVINPSIAPSNASDSRLGTKWGSTTSTTGWELIVAVENINDYTADQLEALKTSHGFCSRAGSVDTATVKEATVKAYCTLGYSAHTNAVTYGFDGEDKYTANFCKFDGCTRCTEKETTKYGTLFTNKGYSKEDGSASFTYGIVFNMEAIALYEEKMTATFDYGFVVGSVPAETDGKIVNADGTTTLQNSVITNVSGTKYSIYNVKLVGIDTDEYKALEVYCCAYIIDNGSVLYAGEEIADTASPICYNDVKVVPTTPSTDEEAQA